MNAKSHKKQFAQRSCAYCSLENAPGLTPTSFVCTTPNRMRRRSNTRRSEYGSDGPEDRRRQRELHPVLRRATRVHLLIFDNPDSKYPCGNSRCRASAMSGARVHQRRGPRRVLWLPRLGPQFRLPSFMVPRYTFGFKSDFDTGQPLQPNKLLLDPYAKAVHRKHDWSKGMAASGPYRHEDTTAAAARYRRAR